MTHSESVIQKAREGDVDAVNKLVSLWYKRIYNFTKKYFNDHDIAQEVTQKTFIAMYKNIKKLQDDERFRPWLYRIASNFCHEEERKKKRSAETHNFDGDKTGAVMYVTDGDETDKRLQISELNEIIFSLLSTLPPEQREVLIMKEYEGLKFREIADILNESENTVKSRLYYALSALKKETKKRNINKNTVYYEA